MLQLIRDHAQPNQTVFVGVIDPINARVETPEEVRDRVVEAAEFIPLQRLGTTDDCGFAPFSDDNSTARATAFEKIRASNRYRPGSQEAWCLATDSSHRWLTTRDQPDLETVKSNSYLAG